MTGMEILNEMNRPSIYIGKVEKIDIDIEGKTEPNSIEFSIPGVMEDIVKYPIARLIGNRTRRVEVGDTVFIIKQGSFNNVFFYMPMDISDFIGCAYNKDNYIKFDKESINIKLDNTSININHNSDDEYTIDILNGKQGKINIDKNGYVTINGHLKVTI